MLYHYRSKAWKKKIQNISLILLHFRYQVSKNSIFELEISKSLCSKFLIFSFHITFKFFRQKLFRFQNFDCKNSSVAFFSKLLWKITQFLLLFFRFSTFKCSISFLFTSIIVYSYQNANRFLQYISLIECTYLSI